MNSLFYISNEFDVNKYKEVVVDSIGYELAQRIKEIVE